MRGDPEAFACIPHSSGLVKEGARSDGELIDSECSCRAAGDTPGKHTFVMDRIKDRGNRVLQDHL